MTLAVSVLIQYRLWQTDSQTARQTDTLLSLRPALTHSVARVKMQRQNFIAFNPSVRICILPPVKINHIEWVTVNFQWTNHGKLSAAVVCQKEKKLFFIISTGRHSDHVCLFVNCLFVRLLVSYACCAFSNSTGLQVRLSWNLTQKCSTSQQ